MQVCSSLVQLHTVCVALHLSQFASATNPRCLSQCSVLVGADTRGARCVSLPAARGLHGLHRLRRLACVQCHTVLSVWFSHPPDTVMLLFPPAVAPLNLAYFGLHHVPVQLSIVAYKMRAHFLGTWHGSRVDDLLFLLFGVSFTRLS